MEEACYDMHTIKEEVVKTDDEMLDKRFWAFVDKSESDCCWFWLGGTDSDGNGRLSYGGKRQTAHKLSYVLHHGPVPEHMLVLRSCKNKLCVNPDHLYVGTQADISNKMESSPTFIEVSERGKTVFRIVEQNDKPVLQLIDEVRAMEVLRGHYKTTKSDAMRNAIIFYHAALKRGLTQNVTE